MALTILPGFPNAHFYRLPLKRPGLAKLMKFQNQADEKQLVVKAHTVIYELVSLPVFTTGGRFSLLG